MSWKRDETRRMKEKLAAVEQGHPREECAANTVQSTGVASRATTDGKEEVREGATPKTHRNKKRSERRRMARQARHFSQMEISSGPRNYNPKDHASYDQPPRNKKQTPMQQFNHVRNTCKPVEFWEKQMAPAPPKPVLPPVEARCRNWLSPRSPVRPPTPTQPFEGNKVTNVMKFAEDEVKFLTELSKGNCHELDAPVWPEAENSKDAEWIVVDEVGESSSPPPNQAMEIHTSVSPCNDADEEENAKLNAFVDYMTSTINCPDNYSHEEDVDVLWLQINDKSEEFIQDKMKERKERLNL